MRRQTVGVVTILCWIPVIIGLSIPSYVSLNNLFLVGPKAHQSFAESVAIGAQMGIEECHHQFRWERWNCPLMTAPVFNQPISSYLSREMSFVQAVTAAGVTYTLTRNCSVGDFEGCQCDDSKKGTKGGANWHWGGCSDNVRFGEKITRTYLDGMETNKDPRASIALHNNEAGRRAVRKTMRTLCKCHGVSGACTTKTCWKRLSDFRNVGDFLKSRYNRAQMIDLLNVALQETTNRNRRNKRKQSPKSTDLVFIDNSPDYCRINGTFSTLGRECSRPKKSETSRAEEEVASKNKPERRSCNKLCKSCGLKVRKRLVVETNSCNCKFHWCCEVRCETCQQQVEKLTCSLI